ncbi:BBSome-interacting protein 1 [Chrysoperla carnea]|uniref:BBSome-interacting protein 1 n=1 Tax=Chrysoperla carnea TaxID=189513 RepID=UPI001D074F53|nr:BBSome-interacting protein 1 [Chrysoperla carnea]
MSESTTQIKPVLPINSGQLFFEDSKELILCKPRLMPLKSLTLEKLEKMQQLVESEMKVNANLNVDTK